MVLGEIPRQGFQFAHSYPSETVLDQVAINLMAADNGQVYIDEVQAFASQHGAKDLHPFVTRIRAAIEQSTDFADLQERIQQVYRDSPPPTDLAEMTMKAYQLSQLAGHLQIQNDVEDNG